MKKRTPKISIIISTYNRAHFLVQCLDSLLSQTILPHQIIVVNDGSDDKTADILKSYMEHIEYYPTPQRGRPHANNEGLKHVTGDYVWVFDDDDIAVPDALERLVMPLEKHSECGFSYGQFYYTANDPETNHLGEIKSVSDIPVEDIDTKGFLFSLLEFNFVGGAALFARTSVYKKIGGFDLELIRSQDYDMALRIAREFKGVQVEGQPLFHYRQHTGLRGHSKDRFTEAAMRQKWIQYDQKIFKKCYESFSLDTYLPEGVSFHGKKRRALLQRMVFMGMKAMLPEVRNDLKLIARCSDKPLSSEEKEIIHSLILNARYYGALILEELSFYSMIAELSVSSKIVRMVRKEICVALWRFGLTGVIPMIRALRRMFMMRRIVKPLLLKQTVKQAPISTNKNSRKKLAVSDRSSSI